MDSLRLGPQLDKLAEEQSRFLLLMINRPDGVPPESNSFDIALARSGQVLRRSKPEILQLNLGKLCNLTCIHCHVSAGPRRKEIISSETVDQILAWYTKHPLPVIDLTGGAPEMAPEFRRIVRHIRKVNPSARILDRCNLVIVNEPGFEWVGTFLEAEELEIVASMPCYSHENVDAQRGNGVFDRSIAALQELNQRGFGTGHSRKRLDLVFNPNGAKLPPSQQELEVDYKRELKKHFDITFDSLITITNLPIARFARWLRREGHYEDYMKTLVDAFNPSTVNRLMCRNTISVGWRGEIYDCDFNQMLDMRLADRSGNGLFLWDIDPTSLEGRTIATGDHCFGCTAGSGSSCGGSLVEDKS
ncbi:MAG: arsenosugar biosynthesis radical SAM (seleno)protein ArsS [Verrucomicrobiota bacterium]